MDAPDENIADGRQNGDTERFPIIFRPSARGQDQSELKAVARESSPHADGHPRLTGDFD
jgi:hypothetical protein